MSGMEVVALGNGYSAVKFDDPEDLTKVLAGGPYIIAENFLALKMWEPGFNPFSARISTLLTWVHFNHLPMEYYRDEILYKLASCVGRPVRIDWRTGLATTGRFARICIELNLNEPLVPKVWVANAWRQVEYEGITIVCDTFGRAAHSEPSCKFSVKSPTPATQYIMAPNGGVAEQIKSPAMEVVRSQPPSSSEPDSSKFFGEWMVVGRRKPRQPRMDKSTERGSQGNGTRRQQSEKLISKEFGLKKHIN
ncbi:unnamed protein product [Linum tenue]|uniref:DUF4283 domain-containing protein n=1 Tax=Linum tenue TaxID=586396 RepID=A0AAV0KJ66_9ROSI|nr:unnamed protein product [Linum tenue]